MRQYHFAFPIACRVAGIEPGLLRHVQSLVLLDVQRCEDRLATRRLSLQNKAANRLEGHSHRDYHLCDWGIADLEFRSAFYVLLLYFRQHSKKAEAAVCIRLN